MIEISKLKDYTKVDETILNLDYYNWLVFTSMYAVEHFFHRIFDTGKDTRILSNIKIASIGKVTSGRLYKYGINPDIQATKESSDGVLKLFRQRGINNANILIPRSNLAQNLLPDGLESIGNIVDKLTVYENNMPQIKKKFDIENFDQVIFTSPSGVDNFIKVYGKLPLKPEIISRGKETRKRINNYEQ
jgi:uroporphyrinogen III methyltransferase/synthase